jgi:hypothetical protein
MSSPIRDAGLPVVAGRSGQPHLGLLKDAGFDWVKQYFAWQDIEGGKGQFDWSRTDRIVERSSNMASSAGSCQPGSDKPFWAGNPPENTQHFADFLAAMSARYKGRIGAYQVWNEPNLAREWGNRPPNPAAYAQMLRQAYRAIKANDPNTTVITAGMAPTTQDDAIAMPDLKFYQGLYDAMNGNSDGYFDMLGVHGAGYAVAPETDPQVVATDPKLHNNDPSPTDLKRVYAFRHIEDVRDLMVRNGDGDKRVVVLEFGWTTDPRPNSPYYWHGGGAGIKESVKGDYLVRAYTWAAEHGQPWIALMSGISMPDVDWTKEDEQYYWSIIGPGYPTPSRWLYQSLHLPQQPEGRAVQVRSEPVEAVQSLGQAPPAPPAANTGIGSEGDSRNAPPLPNASASQSSNR